MEQATDKQIGFMTSLGLPIPAGCTKADAKVLIQNKLADSDSVPVEKPGQSKPYTAPNNSYYVAYAKDVFVAIVDKITPASELSVPEAQAAFSNIMQTSINLIKMAREQL